MNPLIRESLKEYFEIDAMDNPIPHLCIGDLKFAAQWDNRTYSRIRKLFRLIKSTPSYDQRQKLISAFYETLDRKYNDQTIRPECDFDPLKVGKCVDKVVANGIQQIGLWATGTNFNIYPYMIAGSNTAAVLYGDTQTTITEIGRVNVVTTDGFLDPTVDGWTASGGFPRTTISGTVAEIAMGNTNSSATSQIFDRSLLPSADRIAHVQNQDSFTLSSIYVLTSI